LGKIAVVSTSKAILQIQFKEGGHPDHPFKVDKSWIEVKDLKKVQLLNDAKKQLDEYFEGKRKEFDLTFQPNGTDFQKDVWKALQKVSYGKTVSYTELAELMGKESKSGNQWHVARAVGSANARNPIAICVPCHRVIGKGGKLTGYSGGLERKAKLLELEQKNASKISPFFANKSKESPPKNGKSLCPYGSMCYRKNAEHLKEYYHEGVDPKEEEISEEEEKEIVKDLFEKSDDNALPICAYGESCARKNPQHFKEYSHVVKKPIEEKIVEENIVKDETNGLPACMYGINCVRQNPKHFEEYFHPKELVEKRKMEDEDSKSPKKLKLA